MKLFNRHKTIINATFALLFFISNSGFTAIVGFCKDGEMQKMSCCAADTKKSKKHCDCNESSAPSGLSYQGNSSCHTNSTIGGLPNLQALLEKSLNNSKEKLLSFFVLPIADFTSDLIQHTKTPFSNTIVLSTSLTSVEKCVLFSTFLI